MKQFFLLFLVTFISKLVFCQQFLAFIKPGLISLPVYDSAGLKVLDRIDETTYFVCEKSSQSRLTTGDGFIQEKDIILFRSLPLGQQKQRINTVLTHFYSICNSNKTIMVAASGSQPLVWEQYYQKSFYPILNEFFNYYKNTKDTSTLLRVMKCFYCHPDGEFAETFYSLIGYCYDLDQPLFLKQLNKIRNSNIREDLINILLDAIANSYSYRYKDLSEEKLKELIRSQQAKVRTSNKHL